MADIELSSYVTGLSSATLTGTEELYLVGDEKTTTQDIANLAAGGGGNLGNSNLTADAAVRTYSLTGDTASEYLSFLNNSGDELLTVFGNNKVSFGALNSSKSHNIYLDGGGAYTYQQIYFKSAGNISYIQAYNNQFAFNSAYYLEFMAAGVNIAQINVSGLKMYANKNILMSTTNEMAYQGAGTHVSRLGGNLATDKLSFLNYTGTSILELKGMGVVNCSNLPTSSAGLVAGDIWNNAGVLNII